MRALLPMLLAAGLAGCTATWRRYELEGESMGTRFRIVSWSTDAGRAERAAAAALARIEELDRALSDYDPESDLSRFSASSDAGPPGPAVALSDDLWTVLAAAQELAELTGGAFDVTVGPAVRLWRRAARQGELPAAERLATARAAIGWRSLELDAERREGRLLRAGMRLDLGGIAKGHALDEALAVLREHGIERALVDGGGDVAAGAAPPGERGWRIALRPHGGEAPGAPPIVLAREHAAVATSGDAYRLVEIDGRRYSHLLDPATGLGLETRVAASVVAPSGMQADALASAACVLGAERALALLEELPRVEARVTSGEKGASEACGTSGFARMMVAARAAEPQRGPRNQSP